MARISCYCILALATLAAGVGVVFKFARGHLTADDPVHDLGEVSPGESYHHDFLIRNRGWTDVTVSKVSSSCMCSKPRLVERVIKAGESVTAEVEMVVPHGRLKPDATVSIFMVGHGLPLKLHLHGRVSPICELYPPEISLGGVPWSEIPTKAWDFTIRSRFPDSCHVEMMDRLDPPSAIAELTASRPGERGLRVRLVKDCPVGLLTAKMRLTARDASLIDGVYQCSKVLRGYVTGPARAEPMSLTVGSEIPARLARVKIVPAEGVELTSWSVSFISQELAQIIGARADQNAGELLVQRIAREGSDAGDSLGAEVSGVIVLSIASNRGDFRLSIPTVVFLPG